MTFDPPRPPEVKVNGAEGQTYTVSRDALNKAKMATFDRTTISPKAEAWVYDIVAATLAFEAENTLRSRARREKDLASFGNACGAFAHDLLLHSGHEASLGFMFRSLNRAELSFSLVSSTHFEQMIEAWLRLGWLEYAGHIDAKDDWEGKSLKFGYSRTRRYRATELFLAKAQRFGIASASIKDHFQLSHRHADVIQLRNKKENAAGRSSRGKAVRGKGPKFDICQDQVKRLNKLMQDYDYSLSEPPAVRRLFLCADRPGFDFNLGGRFHCISSDDWMAKPKQERNCILINGQTTFEIDVRASHLSILYALCGERIDLEQDPYELGDYPRDIVKKVVVAAMGNGGLPNRWPKVFNKEYREEHGCPPRDRYKLKDLAKAIRTQHPVIDQLQTDQLDWANLQFEESECFLETMLKLHDEGVPSLPVHDSIIVRKSDIGLAISTLSDAYKVRFGFKPWLSNPLPP